MDKFFKMAWRNMWRNWRRTTIALVAIVLGLVLLIFFDGMITGSDQAIFGNAVKIYGGNLQVHAPGYRDKVRRLPLLPLENADEVVAAATGRPEVVAAAKRINTGGVVLSGDKSLPVTITAVEPAVEAQFSLQAASIADGRYLLEEEGDAILIGKGLADRLGLEVGDRTTLLGHSKYETLRQRTMTVVGIYDVGAPDLEKGMVFITLPEAQSLYNLRDQVTEVAIMLQDVNQEVAVLPNLQSELPSYEVDTWKTLKPEITETMSTKAMFTSLIGLIVVIIASIGILNLQLMAVFERTREMGVLTAMGMKGRQVMWLFLLEGTMIGLIGAVVGCLLGLGLLALINQAGGFNLGYSTDMGDIVALMGDRLYPSVTTTGVLVRGLAVVVIAALASLYPAWQASRKEPAAALHHV